jgi:hypothetical protein
MSRTMTPPTEHENATRLDTGAVPIEDDAVPIEDRRPRPDAESDGGTVEGGMVDGVDIAEDDLVDHGEDGAGPAGPVANLVASLVALGVAVFGVVGAYGLGVGSPSQPGPGTWPLIISVVIGGLALAQLLVGLRGSGGERFSRASLIPVVGFATLLGMVALMPVIGFEIPAALLCFVWLKLLGGESWRSALLGSVLIPAAFYLIFIAALSTSIPHLF